MSSCRSGMEMEVSSYIHPPFKIATFWSNGLGIKEVVELCMSDVSQSSGVFAMELHCEFWYGYFGGGLPGIVFVAISFLFNEILESSLVPMTVKYLLYFPLCFSIDDYGQWIVFCFLSCDWVIRSQSKLYYVEYWMKLLHPV